jgi:hypothetical protein
MGSPDFCDFRTASRIARSDILLRFDLNDG